MPHRDVPSDEYGPQPPNQVQRNIAAIAQLEKSALDRRSVAERVSESIVNFAGSMKFVSLHIIWIGTWIFLNRRGSSLRFDPFPYNILILMLAVEAILLSTFVLIAQNHMTKMSDRRAHLNLQISLLAESEMTKMLETLRTILLRLGMPDEADDEQFRDLSRVTNVGHVVQALEEQLPDSSSPGHHWPAEDSPTEGSGESVVREGQEGG